MMQPRLGSHSLPVVQASNPAVFVPLCMVVQYPAVSGRAKVPVVLWTPSVGICTAKLPVIA